MARGQPHPLPAAVPDLLDLAPANSSISYRWTHLGEVGQTEARLNRETGDLEIRDGEDWIRCHPDCVRFFTPQEVAPPSLL